MVVNMSTMHVEPNIKRGKTLILWSALYLGASWLSVIAGLINPGMPVLMITDILTIFIIPAGICVLIFLSLWVRSLIITARYIQPAGIGYRQGWAFWSWFTPIACFWIPRRLITRPFDCFAWFTGRSNFLPTNLWWGLFVASQAVGYFSIRVSINFPEVANIFDIISAIILTIAFPQWKKIVEAVTAAQGAAVERITSQQTNSPQR
jgi:hypothetical protein